MILVVYYKAWWVLTCCWDPVLWWWWWWRRWSGNENSLPRLEEPGIGAWRISRTANVFLISLTRWDGQPVLLRGGGGDSGGGGSSGGSQWLLNQTMGYRVPLVLSGIPLLPGETPQPLSVDGTASEVKGGVACVCMCGRSSWFSSLLITAENRARTHRRLGRHICVCCNVKILQILRDQRRPQLRPHIRKLRS